MRIADIAVIAPEKQTLYRKGRRGCGIMEIRLGKTICLRKADRRHRRPKLIHPRERAAV